MYDILLVDEIAIMDATAKSRLRETLCKIEGAYAPATIRAYRADFAAFIEFCESLELDVWPASPETVALFVEKLSDGRLKSASIRRSVAGISTIYRLNRMPDPTKDPEVLIAMRRMHRKLGREARQAKAINQPCLEKVLAATGNDLRGIRDRVLLLLGYDTLCRRSELVSLKIDDIEERWVGEKTRILIRLRKSKTDQHRSGRFLTITERTQAAIEDWLEATGLHSGYLLRGVDNGGKVTEDLKAGQVNRIYKRLAKEAKLDQSFIKGVSGHSLRVGAAQDLLHSGASMPIIMNRGRWSKTDTVMRYLEYAEVI